MVSPVGTSGALSQSGRMKLGCIGLARTFRQFSFLVLVDLGEESLREREKSLEETHCE